MDEGFFFYVCETLADHAVCSAVSKGAKDPKWTLPLEDGMGVSSLALIPESLSQRSMKGCYMRFGMIEIRSKDKFPVQTK